ncbi:hypothetical protein [Mycoplasma sp. CSL7503-lung]|uniref:hypothetical protein n=1 Tax=Mycoplasma sp. CSL7503-lung TaxID=536372 RepID=UPI0021D03BCA|nr:hypothetical protein [Mycoplasma sp. CSL7503-lung]MCU4706688.1 hypothetical protein [Mycoplasma sp. CSL7503-lung]
MKKIKLFKKMLLPLLGSSVIVVASCSNQVETNASKESKEKENKETTEESKEKETGILESITKTTNESETEETNETDTETEEEANSDSDEDEDDGGIFGSSVLSNLVGLLKGDSDSSGSVWSGGSSDSEDEDENSLKQQASKKLNEAWGYYDTLADDEDGKYYDLSNELKSRINNTLKETGYLKGNLTDEEAQNVINRLNELLEDVKAKKEAIDGKNSSVEDTTKETREEQGEGEELNSNSKNEEKQENPEEEQRKRMYGEIEDIILEAYDYDIDELSDEKYKPLSDELMKNINDFKQKLNESKETLSEEKANELKAEIRKIIDDIKLKKETMNKETSPNNEETENSNGESVTSESSQSEDEETAETQE